MNPTQNDQEQGSRLLDESVVEIAEDFIAPVTPYLLNDGKFLS